MEYVNMSFTQESGTEMETWNLRKQSREQSTKYELWSRGEGIGKIIIVREEESAQKIWFLNLLKCAKNEQFPENRVQIRPCFLPTDLTKFNSWAQIDQGK